VTIPITKSEIFFPNIFTPNRQENNRFRAYYTNITDFEIWIYDRRGDLVYHSTDINEGWDGTHEDRPCVQAAYVYTCTYKDTITPGGVMKKTGTVVLVR
jgi:gliding motility-associated-like protein